jgi:hypothetical protein
MINARRDKISEFIISFDGLELKNIMPSSFKKMIRIQKNITNIIIERK